MTTYMQLLDKYGDNDSYIVVPPKPYLYWNCEVCSIDNYDDPDFPFECFECGTKYAPEDLEWHTGYTEAGVIPLWAY